MVASVVAAGVHVSVLARSAVLVPGSGSGSLNASNWAKGASADPSAYFAFTVTPVSGCTLQRMTLALDVRASSTGPSAVDVATSADGFQTRFGAFATGSPTTVTLPTASSSGPLEVRVYGYGAASTLGTLRIQNAMTLSGDVH